jgi:hypothetical protein
MATQAVPGADPRNLDDLSVGCWAEDKDRTSLIHVIGHEGGSVVFQLYDLHEDPSLYYQDAMMEDEFKDFFSVPPVGSSDVPWTWHDKTTFPWDRVMKRFSGKAPQYADVQDHLSVAQKIAQKLGLRGKRLAKEEVTPQVEQRRNRGMAIIERIAESVGKMVE